MDEAPCQETFSSYNGKCWKKKRKSWIAVRLLRTEGLKQDRTRRELLVMQLRQCSWFGTEPVLGPLSLPEQSRHWRGHLTKLMFGITYRYEVIPVFGDFTLNWQDSFLLLILAFKNALYCKILQKISRYWISVCLGSKNNNNPLKD